MPKYRVPSSEKDAPCRRSPPSPSRARPPGRHPTGADNCGHPHGRGLRGRSASDPGRRTPPADRHSGLGFVILRQSAVTVCQQGQAQRGCRGLDPPCGRYRRGAGGRFRGVGQAELAFGARSQAAAARPTGRTVWVTRARPKIDRIACPWLIRRFVDPGAAFLFVHRGRGRGRRFAAIPFDVENVFWSHRGEECTFDVMVAELALPPSPCCISHGSSAPLTPLVGLGLRPQACSPCPWGCPDCTRTISRNWRLGLASTMRSIAGAGRDRRDPQLAHQPAA